MFRLLFVFLLVSCASHKHSTQSHYMKSESYESRPELSESFFKKSPDNFTEEQIQKLLNSKIQKKNNIKLAVLEFSGRGIDSKEEKSLVLLLSEIPKLKDVSYVPSFLLQNKYTLANMRDSAALMQADYLLIVKNDSTYNYEFRILKSDEAISKAQMEVALMDISTGAVPFTSKISGTSKTRYNKNEDFNSQEFREKSMKAAEDEAFKSLTQDLIKFWKEAL